VKTCTFCGERKPESEYSFMNTKQLFSAHCKVCDRKRLREYYKKNKEKVLKTISLYRSENQDKIKDSKREYYKKNTEKIKKRDALRYTKNTEKIKTYQRAYRLKKKKEREDKQNVI
jgi:hypothetical protein